MSTQLLAVEARGLTKRYKTALAVDNIDIAVPAGCCCGFLGKNGAGKTTTLKMLVGLKKPTVGSISIMERPQLFGRGGSFGYLPDVPNFYGYMNGAEFLTFCAKLCGIPAAARGAKVKALLEKVGLSKARAAISGYSRGMKQRLGIAQALINDPQVIFMDEPVSALDPIGRRDVIDIIHSLKAGGDKTVIFSTHILNDVEEVCDYVLIIEKGRIMAQDYLADLKARHKRDEGEVRFHDAETAAQFAAAVGNAPAEGGLLAQPISPVAFTLRLPGADSRQLSRHVNALLHAHALPMESYAAHNPSLEDIFYATINNEGGAL
ncbi:MAG: ABC transporter ATP-binding protein [Defluviitaleaceae bacterium]|nr:ABC transporter ATP-binding protein [Defluviitaleaceae bacterium]MCL2239772.1 ABC transporter ATP-binding protein [Defluviitaleaceae bacterium]